MNTEHDIKERKPIDSYSLDFPIVLISHVYDWLEKIKIGKDVVVMREIAICGSQLLDTVISYMEHLQKNGEQK